MKIQGKQIANPPALTTADKADNPAAVVLNDRDTNLTIANKPIGYVQVMVNGVQKRLGDAVNTLDAYFVANASLALGEGGNGPACLLLSNGTAWCLGDNSIGAVGDNTTVNKSSPTSVVGAHSFTSLHCGGSDLIGLKVDGTVWTWGGGANGRLGDNTTANKSSPVSVVGGHSAAFITCDGGGYAGLLKSNNGTIWLWGSNASGQLADNTTVDKSSPVSMIGAHSFTSISSGLASIALKTGGDAWAWGLGTSGQLGQNTSAVNRSSPVSVVGAHVFTKVVSGALLTNIAMKSDGSVWSWGSGASGANGDNTTINRSSPVSVVGTHSFIDVVCQGVSQSHTIGLKSDGSIWCWGGNPKGELGDNTTVDKSSPISVNGGGQFFVNIGIGNNSSYARARDGSLWAWGLNSSGQLGDNTTVDKSSPISVLQVYQLPRSIAAIVAGDHLIWNAVRASQNLAVTDIVDLDYIV